MTSTSIRLNKHLALQLGISRREADELIASGKVTVNDVPAELGRPVTPHDAIRVNGELLGHTTTLRYLALHKPIGYVSSRRQQGDIPTIYSLLAKKFHHLKPVGRLDKDSSGLLLLTNDGDFAHRMTHPSFRKTKSYEVSLNRDLEPLHQQMINDFGVTLEDGPSKLQLSRLSDTHRRDWQVTMHEGRNRQIRRTFSALGYVVVRLHRTEFGPYQLGQLPEGKWQEIKPL
ncbi:MAG TPA: pseudouridine synthase [Verrucomicrobiae bacterium]|nr:pseudouridine synthase [Verrucomicrobiae bacterium]